MVEYFVMLWKKTKNHIAPGSTVDSSVDEIEQARQDIMLANLERLRRKEHVTPVNNDDDIKALIEHSPQKVESPKPMLKTVVTDVSLSCEDSDFVTKIMRQIVSSDIEKWRKTPRDHSSQ